MTIFEIDKEIQNLVDPETGELKDYEAFEALQMERDQKLDNVGAWVKDLTAQAKAIREEEQALAERRRVLENKAERLKKYLDLALQGSSFSSARCAISYRKSTSVDITDEAKLIRWAKRNKLKDLFQVKTTINKTEAGKLLKTGAGIPGAALVEKNNIQIK